MRLVTAMVRFLVGVEGVILGGLTGAAAEPPWPPFSTSNASAILGCSAGA